MYKPGQTVIHPKTGHWLKVVAAYKPTKGTPATMIVAHRVETEIWLIAVISDVSDEWVGIETYADEKTALCQMFLSITE